MSLESSWCRVGGSQQSGVGESRGEWSLEPRFESSGGQSGSSECSPACRATQNYGSVEKAGERSPASDIAVRGDRASGRSEQMLRNGRALKKSINFGKSKGPFVPLRRRRLGPIHQAARRGLGQPSRVAPLAVLTKHRGSPSESPRGWQVTSTASRSSCGLHSSTNIKGPRVQFCPFPFLGFFFV